MTGNSCNWQPAERQESATPSHGTPGWDETTSMAAICKAMELANPTKQRPPLLAARHKGPPHSSTAAPRVGSKPPPCPPSANQGTPATAEKALQRTDRRAGRRQITAIHCREDHCRPRRGQHTAASNKSSPSTTPASERADSRAPESRDMHQARDGETSRRNPPDLGSNAAQARRATHETNDGRGAVGGVQRRC